MTKGNFILFFLLVLCQDIWAQQDSIALKEVTVSDVQLQKFSETQQTQRLNDSVIAQEQPSLTSLLNYHSAIYFKENGLGMVSSPSFRGTTAQQTAVIWNGININSQLNGQTDFNTITAHSFENITVRSGGGSAIYGSSAIGGSIHLNNDLYFGNNFTNEFALGYGSFETYQAQYKVKASNDKVSVNAGISHNRSQNDYPHIDSRKGLKNENGQFYNSSFNVAFGFKMGRSNWVKLYSQIFDGERHFSLIRPTDTKTRYRDFNTRNLLEWTALLGRFVSKAKVAFLTEEYHYFGNINSDNFTFGRVETLVGKYDLAYTFNSDMALNAIVDFTQNKGAGSDISTEKRQIGSASLLWKHAFDKFFVYEVALRKEVTSNYDSPFLFSAGAKLAPVGWYALKANLSKNFRIPTFNDLYWQEVGNPELKPEHSVQFEIGQELRFGGLRISATYYQIKLRDMIRWLPGQGGLFSPVNTDRVLISGVETILGYEKKIGRHHLNSSITYAYTDSRNRQTKKQLIYVPFHKATANLGYNFGRLSMTYQHLYNGFVFTQSDNNPLKQVDAYQVSNAEIGYNYGKKQSVYMGFKVLNLWEEKYESVEGRPMPGRYYNTNLIFKF